MKITFNGKISSKVVEAMLMDQQVKKQNIINFCEAQKIEELQYKDAELEFEYKKETQKPKVETRPKQQNKEVR